MDSNNSIIMNKLRLQFAAACLACIAFNGLLCIGSEFDFCEQVILHMSQEEYDHVKDTLTKINGSSPSDRQIAHWWADHHNDAE